MKILFLGQGTGGNALLWFEFFNNNKDVEVHFLARTIVTLEHKFKVFKPYGKKERKGLVGKLYNWVVAKFIFKFYVSYITRINKYDLVVLQGNYTPALNLYLIKKCKTKTILNIYGSDFYRKYLLGEFSREKCVQFQEVVNKVDGVFCNWETTKADFLASFPQLDNKVFSSPWGIDKTWNTASKTLQEESDKMKFISTRALHAYNNVELVVEAFCESFHNDENKVLHIVSAYGESKGVLEKINNIIEKFNMGDRVLVETSRWYEGQELIDLYDSANFNICFGSSDQLTLSIVYAFSRRVTNILSPLANYRELGNLGFCSHIMAPEISVESLKRIFLDIDNIYNKEALCKDAKLVYDIFNQQRTFNSYLEFASIIGDEKSEF